LILTEVKGAGGVETFPQDRAWHSNLKPNSITLRPSMSANMITRTSPSVNRDIFRLLEKLQDCDPAHYITLLAGLVKPISETPSHCFLSPVLSNEHVLITKIPNVFAVYFKLFNLLPARLSLFVIRTIIQYWLPIFDQHESLYGLQSPLGRGLLQSYYFPLVSSALL
jgi:hypothetical protein